MGKKYFELIYGLCADSSKYPLALRQEKNGLLEDDIDAPLRSGIIRVFNQPCIEASIDGGGFVEVRYKRNISNEWKRLTKRETNTEYKVLVRKADS
ncbi:hypothetical protein MA16_Dca028463 [Dendrobium catenatum]|uniref:Uncharacterized protein n=1 Tax=Dendrobium catenatum TaxID=906689 RepID=A0A2I0V9C6_9ASPA|nr:hypothetical protein MA16_Dca028463 [Dendrobium catenatum]